MGCNPRVSYPPKWGAAQELLQQSGPLLFVCYQCTIRRDNDSWAFPASDFSLDPAVALPWLHSGLLLGVAVRNQDGSSWLPCFSTSKGTGRVASGKGCGQKGTARTCLWGQGASSLPHTPKTPKTNMGTPVLPAPQRAAQASSAGTGWGGRLRSTDASLTPGTSDQGVAVLYLWGEQLEVATLGLQQPFLPH